MTISATTSPASLNPAMAANAAPTAQSLAASFQQLNVALQQLTLMLAQLQQSLPMQQAGSGAATLGGGGIGSQSCTGPQLPASAMTQQFPTDATSGAAIAQAPPAKLPAPVTPPTPQASTGPKPPAEPTPPQSSPPTQAGPTTPTSGTPATGAFRLTKNNPRTPEQAVAAALAEAKGATQDWTNRCLNFVGRMYGYQAAGTDWAIHHYEQMPADKKHPGDRNPPAGALVYWKTSSKYGHVAMSLGNGMVASTDVPKGKVGVISIDDLTRRWNANYLGWTEPEFPNGAK